MVDNRITTSTSKPVNLIYASSTGGYAEGYVDCMMGMHSLKIASYGSSIGSNQYQVADYADIGIGDGGTYNSVIATQTAANLFKNGFIMCKELETLCQIGDLLLSGINTLWSQVFFECNINTAPAVTYTIDLFAYADVIYVLENGLIGVRFEI